MRFRETGRGYLIDLDINLFNFLVNLPPDDLMSNAYFRPSLAKLLGLRCGPKCQIRKNIYYDGHRRLVIGKNVFLNRHAYIDSSGGITIGDNVRFGPEVMLITGDHHMGDSEMRAGEMFKKPIVIEDGCWIGTRAVITAGVTIGRGSIVSAGAVVLRSMPANFLIAGNPARPVSQLVREHNDA